MESNWRWNVFELGMHRSDWQLAARWAVQPVPGLTFYVVKTPTTFEAWYVPAPGQLPLFFWSTAIPSGLGGFPYTWPVDPD